MRGFDSAKNSIPVIRQAGAQGVGAVQLFGDYHEGEFVLQRQRAEGSTDVGCRPKFIGVAVGTANQQRDVATTGEFPFADGFGEFATGPTPAALVENHPVHALARPEQRSTFRLRIGRLLGRPTHFRKPLQPT